MHHRCRRRRLNLHDEVAVRHSVDAVSTHSTEAQLARDKLPIKRIGHAGQCPGAQWQLVCTRAAVEEAARVAVEHLEVREEMMWEAHRLRALKMRVPGHNRILSCLSQMQQRCLQASDL